MRVTWRGSVKADDGHVDSYAVAGNVALRVHQCSNSRYGAWFWDIVTYTEIDELVMWPYGATVVPGGFAATRHAGQRKAESALANLNSLRVRQEDDVEPPTVESWCRSLDESFIDDVKAELQRLGISITVTKQDWATAAVVIGGLLSALASGEAARSYLQNHPELLNRDLKPMVQQIVSKLMP